MHQQQTPSVFSQFCWQLFNDRYLFLIWPSSALSMKIVSHKTFRSFSQQMSIFNLNKIPYDMIHIWEIRILLHRLIQDICDTTKFWCYYLQSLQRLSTRVCKYFRCYFRLVIAGRSQFALRPQQCEGNVNDVFGFAFNDETKKWSQKTDLEVQKAWYLWYGYLFNIRFVFTLVVRFWIRYSTIKDTSNRVM